MSGPTASVRRGPPTRSPTVEINAQLAMLAMNYNVYLAYAITFEC
jgi:hypothetical protein